MRSGRRKGDPSVGFFLPRHLLPRTDPPGRAARRINGLSDEG